MPNTNVMYICGKCGFEVSKDETVCPKCGARLGDIKCPYCKYTGTPKDFKNDRCPRCGKKNILSVDLNSITGDGINSNSKNGDNEKNDKSNGKNSVKNDQKRYSQIVSESDFDYENPFFIRHFGLIFFLLLVIVMALLWAFLKYFQLY